MATDKLVDFYHVTDYISREAAISEILSEPTEAHYPSWYAEKLKQVPAADVVEVVRCRDCVHFLAHTQDCTRYAWGKSNGIENPTQDSFCSYGARGTE